MSQNTMSPMLIMRNIHVSYGDKIALNGVDFDLFSGEIHAIVGEHRAGKSTLVKLLSGAVVKDAGEIFFKGQKIELFTTKTAIKSKIGMVYQNSCIIPSLNAIENIFMGHLVKTWFRKLDYAGMREKSKELLDKLHLNIDLQAPLKWLSEADQQMVEIAKVLSIDPQIMILDEISGKLTPAEMEKLYPLIFEFRNQGKSVIYISHNMDEIFEIADRVTILKNGDCKGTEYVKDLDKFKLLKLTYSFVLSREELERENIKLFYFRKYNENIIKNLPVGVLILDTDHRIYLMNFTAKKIFGIDSEYVINQDVNIMFRENLIEFKDELLTKIKSKEEYTWEEISSGKNRIIKIKTIPFRDEDYVFLGTIILVEDISKDRFLKEYLLRTEKIASVAELGASVAHEINNPLGIVQNYIELLKIQKLDDDGREKLAKVEKEITRIDDIVTSLLSFSRMHDLPNKKIHLVEVIEEVVSLVEHKMNKKHIHFVNTITCQNVHIIGDENRLKQLFLNLLVNSIEAVQDRGVIELELNVCHERNIIDISISDNGYGVPAEIKERIFDPFFSTKDGNSNTGLGLTICHHIVESHHGIISCLSDPGNMTTFNIRFPLLRDG